MTDRAPISGLHIYPFKSGQVIDVDSFQTNERGPEHDRIALAAKAVTGKAYSCELASQRFNPELALIKTEIDGEVLRLDLNGRKLEIPIDACQLTDEGCLKSIVEIHGQTTGGIDVGNTAARMLTEFIHEQNNEARGDTFRIIHRAPTASMTREVKPQFDPNRTPDGRNASQVSFADENPFLITSEASLRAVNEHCGYDTPLEMGRFRPNIVLAGDYDPFFEERLQAIAINGMVINLVKPCGRCPMINNLPKDGSRSGGKADQPLVKLAQMPGRQQQIPTEGNNVVFGMNGIQTQGIGGTLNVGDEVELIWK